MVGFINPYMGAHFSEVVAAIQKSKRKDGKRASLWISKKVYEDFRKLCDAQKVSMSEVIEHWMVQALSETKGKK